MRAPQSDAERELLRALLGMAYQYLHAGNGALDHECMGAGEDAMKVLSEYGLVSDDSRHGRLTPAGEALLDE